MHNITNYSVFYIIELKVRLFYFFLSLFINSVYTIVYLTDFLVQFLQPLEYLNMDLNMDSLCNFLLFTLTANLNFDAPLLSSTIVNEVVFDYYPVFEINMTNNNSLYIGFFIYLNIIYVVPILFYHVYLFITPGLYKYEYKYITRLLCGYFCICVFYIYKVHNILVILVLYITYNNFYEFYNYEFDIDFNLIDYISTNINLILLYHVNIVLLFILYNRDTTTLLYFSYLAVNILLFVNVTIFLLYIFVYYVSTFFIKLVLYKQTYIS
jgi:Sec-independent protein secretion pathway component TatC